MNLIKNKVYSYRIPKKHGPKPELRSITFDEMASRKKILNSIDIPPNSTDEELKNTTIGFAPFSDILKKSASDISVYQYLQQELHITKTSIDNTNEIFKQDYFKKLEEWEKGGIGRKTISSYNCVAFSMSEFLKEIKRVENSPEFIAWIDEYEVPYIDSPNNRPIDLTAFKVGKWFVLAGDTDDLDYIKKHPDFEKELSLGDVPMYDSNTISVFQLKEYDKPSNVLNTVVEMVADREKSPQQQTGIGNMNTSFFTDSYFIDGDNVNDDVEKNVQDLFNSIKL